MHKNQNIVGSAALTSALLPLLPLLLSAGCANFAPPYEQPAPAVPRAAPAPAAAIDELGWRSFLTEARLRRTVELALANNRDLRVAALNVQRARAQYQVTDAQRLPNVSVGGSATRSDRGTNLSASVGMAGFELDFFGRIRNLSDAALQDYLATDESRRSVQIGLVAETAHAWLALAADLERERLIKDTLANRQRLYELNRRMHELGAIAGLALAQAQAGVESARLDAANAALAVEQDRHALELLVGAALPAELAPHVGDAITHASVLVEVPAGVPSELLQRRPDVRAAEHRLQGAHFDIGAARAARFPRIALTASAGSASSSLSGLFSGGSGSWSFGPSISLPIFDGGASRANVEAAKVGREVALAEYDKAVQTAFREVADALAVRASLAERQAAQAALVETTRRQLRLAEAQYRAGGTSQLELLDAERSLYAAEQQLIALRLAEQGNRIALYRTLGGGWNDVSD